MIGAALYLTRRTQVNSFKARVSRLRQPKYVAAFGAGVLYLWLTFLRPGGPVSGLGQLAPETREAIAVLLAAVVLLMTWTLNTSETPFPFTLAETQFLFAAPLTRRQVLLFKIFRSQVGLALSAVVTVFLFRRGQWGLATPIHAVGLWLGYATLNLNSAGMGLLRLSLAQHGIAGVRRRIGTLIVLAAAVAAIWWVARGALPAITAGFAAGFGNGLRAIARSIETGPGAVVSWPLRVLVAPLLAQTPGELFAALPAGLLILGLHVWWVVGSSIAFEEAATDAAVRTARRIEALRQGRGWTQPAGSRRRPLVSARLAPTGRPATAIMWKNFQGIRREFNPRSLVILGVATIAGVLSLHATHLSTTELAGGILLFGAGMVTLLGPLALRFDLRRDLELLEVLKTYPVRGRVVVLGEVGALVATLSAVAGGAAVAAFLLTLGDAALPPWSDRLALLVSILAGIPAVLTVFVLVQNAAVLFFPAWITVGPQRAVGLEATGQRLLMTVGSLLALVVAMVPGAVVGGLGWWGAQAAGASDTWSVAAGVVTAAASIGAEGWLLSQLLGGVFDRMDPSSAGIP